MPADDERRAEIEAMLAAGDALADGVLRWESHVTLEGLAGTYRTARAALDRVRDARGDDEAPATTYQDALAAACGTEADGPPQSRSPQDEMRDG